MSDKPRDRMAERRDEEARRERELSAVKTFHDFLQGVIPEDVTVRRFKKMNPDHAFTVIWFLQEVCHLIPDHYEMCHDCKVIYDTRDGGVYDGRTGKCHCESHTPEGL